MDIGVRAAGVGDLTAVSQIYDHYVRTSPATFDLEPPSAAARREWLERHPSHGPHRAFVATAGGAVVGFATSGPFRDRAAYATSVETSVYIRDGWARRGVGRRLYTVLFEALAGQDLHRAFAGIVPPNPGSVGLHESCGFRHVGTFTEQGLKFGRFWDVAWFERPL